MSAAVYTAREARARFAELLRRVRNGETVAVSYRGAPVAEIRPQAEASAPPPVVDGARQTVSPGEDGAGDQAISPVEVAAEQAVSPGEEDTGQASSVEQGAPEQGGVDLSVFDFPPAAKDEAELEALLADMRRRGVLAPSSQPKRPFKPVCVAPGALERAQEPKPTLPITGEDAANAAGEGTAVGAPPACQWGFGAARGAVVVWGHASHGRRSRRSGRRS